MKHSVIRFVVKQKPGNQSLLGEIAGVEAVNPDRMNF